MTLRVTLEGPSGRLAKATTVATMNEACMLIAEMNLQAADFKSRRRKQIITVLRPDGPVEVWRDMGKADKYKRDQFRIICGGYDTSTGKYWSEHTVGEAIEIAAMMHSPEDWPEPEPQQPYDLISGYHDLLDKEQLQRRKRSMVGPLTRIERS